MRDSQQRISAFRLRPWVHSSPIKHRAKAYRHAEGVMSGIITEPMFLQVFPQMQPKNKKGAIQALVVAIYEIGCLLGSFFIIGFGDKLGRRRAVLLGTIIMLVGTAIQASSTTLAQLIVGRIVTGCGNGMNTSSIPVWYVCSLSRGL